MFGIMCNDESRIIKTCVKKLIGSVLNKWQHGCIWTLIIAYYGQSESDRKENEEIIILREKVYESLLPRRETMWEETSLILVRT